jgi:hypothetical protein
MREIMPDVHFVCGLQFSHDIACSKSRQNGISSANQILARATLNLV